MSVSSIPGRRSRLNKNQKLSIAGIAAVAAASLSLSLVPANAESKSGAEADATVSAAPVAFTSTVGTPQAKALQASFIEKHSTAEKLVKAADLARAKQAAAKTKADEAKKARSEAVAERNTQTRAASRSETRAPVYANNLNGWIRQSLDIMKSRGIPGSYDGLHRNILRESSGNPSAVNGWDINAKNGTPSRGLLQVIQPTFNAYHVPGTSWNIHDPVANITAAANYAADRYGSIDNVNSAY
ncbi:transglycosylase SLT domain-containing protein [Streptomyces sp. NPDC056061]|uniref:transglycosylase SLT domain-containing protein n=1 Tax=Streptomyces sp. NPDC056061 TaxID=3345700 RepID=UPI0035E0901D